MAKPILLVEDNAHDLEFALLALEKCSLPNPVVVARDGEEALDYLFRRNRYADESPEEPALLLLNLKMPKISGVEVIRTLRSTPALAAIPIVVLSHSDKVEDMGQARALGVQHYIVKPFDLKLFIEEVCKASSAHVKD